MRILMSAYGCSPVLGSEPGVGWRWARELALGGHDVTVITHPFFQRTIEEALAVESLERLRFVYVEPQGLGVRRRPGSLNSRAYYVAWQWFAYRSARRLIERGLTFDVVHHITWGTYRFASFFGHLGLPFIFGPVGGGETGNQALVASLPVKERIKEVIRRAFIHSARLDPLVWQTIRSADVVLCKSEDTKRTLPFQPKSSGIIAVRAEIGSPATNDAGVSKSRESVFRMLYAGRLISWKGCHLAIQALAKLEAMGINAELVLVGKGNLRHHLSELATSLGVGQKVIFAGHVAQTELLSMYCSADVFVFPSLHDSSGNVVLEALSRGLPVVCLSLGGPPQFVTHECARIVDADGTTEDVVAERLAASLQEIACMSPSQWVKMSEAAIAHAAGQSWKTRVEDAYLLIARHLRLPYPV